MKKGFYQTISISLLAHLLLITLLVQQSATPPNYIESEPKAKAIKSFLYISPPQEKLVSVQKTSPVEKTIQVEIKKGKNQTKTIDRPKSNLQSKQDNSQLPQVNQAKQPSDEMTTAPPSKFVREKQPLSSHQQLEKLRAQINQRASKYNASFNTKTTSPSVFNQNVIPVPHSTQAIDPEEKRKRNTQQVGAGVSITKNDNGTCSITQDMSVYGLEHGSSTQYFNCGESKFDRSFREHMQQVQKKLGKKK